MQNERKIRLPGEWPVTVSEGSSEVRIYRSKNRGADLFTVTYYVGRVRKRENFADFADAKNAAQRAVGLLARGEHRVMTLTADDAKTYSTVVERLHKIGTPLGAAIDEYLAARELAGDYGLVPIVRDFVRRQQKPIEAIRVSDAVTKFVATKREGSLNRRNLEKRLKKFSDAFSCELADVTASQIEAWLDAGKWHGRNRNNYLNSVRSLFNWAKDTKTYLPRDAESEASRVEDAPEDDKEITTFTPDEVNRLLVNGSDQIITYVALGAFAGIRTEEQTRLCWEDFDWESGEIELGKSRTKTGQHRMVPILPPLVSWLSPLSQKSGPVHKVKKVWQPASRLAKKLELKWENNALRHSFGTYRYAATKNVNLVSAEMGNSPAMVFNNYRRVVRGKIADAFWDLKRAEKPKVTSLASVM